MTIAQIEQITYVSGAANIEATGMRPGFMRCLANRTGRLVPKI